MLPRRSKSAEMSNSAKVSKLEYVFFCRSLWKKWIKWIFSHHSFSLQKLLIAMRNRLGLVMRLSFRLRPSFQILADNHTFKVCSFYKLFNTFFSIPISFWNSREFQGCFYALLKHRSCECSTFLYLWTSRISKWQIWVLVLTYPRRNILLFYYTRT